MSTEKVWTLDIALTLEGPVITGSAAPGAFGVDTPAYRLPDGRRALPGTLVQGRINEVWAELNSLGASFPDAATWFGRKSAGGMLPERGRFQMPFALAEVTVPREPGHITRVSIDEERGAARTQHLQVIEAPYQIGEPIRFDGQGTCVAKEEDVHALADALKKCLLWTGAVGAMAGVGFGRVLDALITANAPETAPLDTSSDRFALRFRLDRPLCVGRRPPIQNVFESDTVIPGGVIKGALASLGGQLSGNTAGAAVFRDAPDLTTHFAKVHVSHAVTIVKGHRPTTPPLTLVSARGVSAMFDVSDCDGPIVIEVQREGQTDTEMLAPIFAPDWKDEVRADANALCGGAEARTVLQVFHRHDPATRRGRDGDLFAYEMVVTGDDEWEAVVDLGAIDDSAVRQRVRDQLLRAAGLGLLAMGKTQARTTTLSVVEPATPVPDCCSTVDAGPWVVTLQTPAILCAPEALADAGALRKAYEQTWNELSSGTLRLTRFFAQQSLAGGPYFHARFSASSAYEPYVLTAPGSVFVLEGVPVLGGASKDTASEFLSEWEVRGVPLPRWAVARYTRNGHPGDDWRSCPYLPQNGYGEIRVNMPLHATLNLLHRPSTGARAVAVKEVR